MMRDGAAGGEEASLRAGRVWGGREAAGEEELGLTWRGRSEVMSGGKGGRLEGRPGGIRVASSLRCPQAVTAASEGELRGSEQRQWQAGGERTPVIQDT
eukprot:3932647-Rhodomonas_salina.1